MKQRLKKSFIANCKKSFLPANYSLYIIPPDSVKKVLDRWAESVPGATKPDMGWHITLKQPFIPCVEFPFIEKIISDACKNTIPFCVSSAEVRKGTHLQRPSLCLVYLTVSSADSVLKNFHRNFVLKISPVISDSYPNLSKKSEGKNYVPHISLTFGVKENKVPALKTAASQLHFNFWVEEIYLLRITNTEETYCWQKFKLGKR